VVLTPPEEKTCILNCREIVLIMCWNLAESPIKAGADVLDVNVGFLELMMLSFCPRQFLAIRASFDIPLCLDSPNPEAIEAALKRCRR